LSNAPNSVALPPRPPGDAGVAVAKRLAHPPDEIASHRGSIGGRSRKKKGGSNGAPPPSGARRSANDDEIVDERDTSPGRQIQEDLGDAAALDTVAVSWRARNRYYWYR